MALLELGLALVICVAAAVGSAVPIGAFDRTRDPRFLLVAGAQLSLLVLGLLWLWGQLPGRGSSVTDVSASALALAALVAVLLLATALVPRRP